MKKSFIIFKIICKLWQRNIDGLLNTRAIRLSIAATLVGLFLFASLAGFKITNTLVKSYFLGDERSLYLLITSLFINSSIFSFLFFFVFQSITPEHTQFRTHLNWFPLNSLERNLGCYLPNICITCLLVLIINIFIFLPSFIVNHLGIGLILLIFFFLLIQTIFINSLLNLIYNLTYSILLKLRLPFDKLLALIVIIFSSVFYISKFFNVSHILSSYLNFDYNLMYFTIPLLTKLTKQTAFMNANLMIILSVLCAVPMLSFLSLYLLDKSKEPKSLTIMSFLPMPKNMFPALIVKEIKLQIRNEENILNFLVLLIICLSLRFYANLNSFNDLILLMLAGFCGMIALNSFGNEQHYFPLYKIIDISPSRLMFSKAFALIIIALLQYAFFIPLLLNLSFNFGGLLKGVLVLINSTVMFFFLGLIIPLSKKAPYSGILSFSVMLLILLPACFILNYLMESVSSQMMLVLVIAFEIFMAATFFFISNWRCKHV